MSRQRPDVMMIFATLAVALLAAEPTAADAVTLRDGVVLLGQVVEPAPPGKLLVLIRRAWAREHAADWSRRWDAIEASLAKRARAQRLDRLRAWRAERRAGPSGEDRLAAVLDGEIARLAGDDGPTALRLVTLARGDVRSVARRDKDAARMLRQGWLAGLENIEDRPIDELKDILIGRGFARSDVDAASVDRLLPIPNEPDDRWRARRAATEVAHEPALRFIRHGDLLLPEGEPGAAPDLGGGAGALATLLGDKPEDPLAGPTRAAAERGRIGLVVTTLEMADDLARVKVEAALWVRDAAGRWQKAIGRPSVARPDRTDPAAAEPLADDPQVQAVFRLIGGLVPLSAEAKGRSLGVGAAVREALGSAQAALRGDLEALALPLGDLAK